MSEPANKKSKGSTSGTNSAGGVVYQGVPGCFSEKAALEYFEIANNDGVRGMPTIADVFSEVEADRASFAVVPIENSYSGSLHQVYDCLLKSSLSILGEIGCVEEHCLLGSVMTTEEVSEVRGHPHILEACSRYLSKAGSSNGSVTQVPSMNSATACVDLAKAGAHVAAIAPREAAALYGLRVIDSGISNDRNAETRYLVVGRSTTKQQQSKKAPSSAFIAAGESSSSGGGSRAGSLSQPLVKTSIVLALPNTVNSIFKIVSQFATRGINIMKMETRPACTGSGIAIYKTSPRHWDYLFYIDFEVGALVGGVLALWW